MKEDYEAEAMNKQQVNPVGRVLIRQQVERNITGWSSPETHCNHLFKKSKTNLHQEKVNK